MSKKTTGTASCSYHSKYEEFEESGGAYSAGAIILMKHHSRTEKFLHFLAHVYPVRVTAIPSGKVQRRQELEEGVALELPDL